MPVVSQGEVLHLQERAVLHIAVADEPCARVAGSGLGPSGGVGGGGCPAAFVGGLGYVAEVGHRYVGEVVVEDVVAIRALQHEAERQAFPCQARGERGGEVGIGVADDGAVGFGDQAVVVEVGIDDLARCGVDAVLLVAVERTDGAAVALQEDLIGLAPQGCGVLVALQAADLVAVEGEVSADVPLPVAGGKHIVAERDLHALVDDVAAVDEHLAEARRRGDSDVLQQVACALVVVVDGEVEAVVEETYIQSGIRLRGRLPAQVGVGRSAPVDHRHAGLQRAAVRVVGGVEDGECAVGADALVTRLAVGDAPLPVGEHLLLLHPCLVDHSPRERAREERCPLVVLCERRRAIDTRRGGEQVPAHERVVRPGEERCQRHLLAGAADDGFVEGELHVGVLRQVVGEVRGGHRLRLAYAALEGGTDDGVDAMIGIERVVEGEQGLAGERFPDVARLACLAVVGRLALLRVAVVVGRTVTVVVAQTEVLTELEPRLDLELQIRRAEPRNLLELVLGAVDVVQRIGGEPVEFVQLLGALVRAVGGREDERRTDDTRVLGVGALEVGRRVREVLRRAYLKPVGYVPAEVHAQSVTLVAGVLDYTCLLGVVARERVPAFVRTAADVRAVLLRVAELVDQLLPVGTGHLVGVAVLVGTDARVEEVVGRGVV